MKLRTSSLKTTVILSALSFLTFFGVVHEAAAHCQVPCGIYDDAARISRLKEDATTIAKAVTELKSLASKSDALSQNQFTRWVMTKEDHASNIISVVSEYFLTQKVKPKSKTDAEYADYLSSLAKHHAVMVAAMKTKQTVDQANVDALNAAIAELEKGYRVHKH